MPNSPASRNTLKRILGEIYPKAQLEIEEAAGGFLVAVISPTRDEESNEAQFRVLLQILRGENGLIAEPDDRVVVFSFEIVRDARALYSERAALRQNPDRFDNGVMIHQFVYGDADLLAHRLDTEALLIDRISRSSCRVIKNPDLDYLARLDTINYRQFDLAGKPFGVSRIVELPDDVWQVLVA